MVGLGTAVMSLILKRVGAPIGPLKSNVLHTSKQNQRFGWEESNPLLPHMRDGRRDGQEPKIGTVSRKSMLPYSSTVLRPFVLLRTCPAAKICNVEDNWVWSSHGVNS